ncbi:MAG: hypothetical protein AB8B99_14260 [Phormidesmis sp.]
MTDPKAQLDQLQATVTQLSGAVNTLVSEFLHPLAQQTLENQKSTTALIARSEQHQEWLDEDRQDVANLRQAQHEQSQQIQALLEDARADRKATTDRFEALLQKIDQRFAEMQTEIRQNQRLLLENQARLRDSDRRLDATLTEVLSLSRRVAIVEDAA